MKTSKHQLRMIIKKLIKEQVSGGNLSLSAYDDLQSAFWRFLDAGGTADQLLDEAQNFAEMINSPDPVQHP